MSSQALAEELLEKADVLTIPGGAFGLGGEGWLRLAYGTMMDEAPMAEGIARIAAHFRSRFG
jgi:aminotransferase